MNENLSKKLFVAFSPEQLQHWDLTENGGSEWKVEDMPGDCGYEFCNDQVAKYFATSFELSQLSVFVCLIVCLSVLTHPCACLCVFLHKQYHIHFPPHLFLMLGNSLAPVQIDTTFAVSTSAILS